MESFNNNKKKSQQNENSFINTLKSINPFSQTKKSINPFSQTKKSIENFKSETSINDLNNSLNTTLNNNLNKKESNKPISSIMEKMSSIKPSEPIRQSLGKVSSLTSESIKNVSQTVSNEQGMSYTKIILYTIIAILLLAFIGFNIFSYLAEGTDILTKFTAPLVNLFAMITGDTAKTTVSNAGTGSKTIINNIEKGTIGSVDYLQKNIKKTTANTPNKSIVNTENVDSLSDNKITNNNEPEPTRTNTLNQGYCYIGKINDTRYCAKVSARDQCMSGDIYPSMDICINPNLRT